MASSVAPAAPTHSFHVPRRFGACVASSGEERCVLHPSNCAPLESYRAAYDTWRVCRVEDIRVGRCSAARRCAPSRDACSSKSMEPLDVDPQCSLVQDNATASAPASASRGPGAIKATWFPACRDTEDETQRCVIDQSYCRPGETFQSPTTDIEAGHTSFCFCQNVQVGLCYRRGLTTDQINANNSQCVVGPFDCPSQTHGFLDGLHLSILDCRLCQSPLDASSEQVGACVQKDFPLPAGNETQTQTLLQAVHHCATDSSACTPARTQGVPTQFLSREKLLQDFNLYCPAAHIPPPMLTLKPTQAWTPAPTPNRPTTPPTRPPAPFPATTVTTNNNPENNQPFVPSSADEQQLTTAAVYWIGIAALVGLAVLGSLGYAGYWSHKRNRNAKQAEAFIHGQEESASHPNNNNNNMPEIA